MSLPHSADSLQGTFGYHPLVADAHEFAARLPIGRALVVGDDVPDLTENASQLRVTHLADSALPSGIFWFGRGSGVDLLIVSDDGMPGASMMVEISDVDDDHDLAAAHQWHEALWSQATDVSKPLFSVGDDVLVRSSGQDSTVKARQFVAGIWLYDLRLDGRRQSLQESQLSFLPDDDDPTGWVAGGPQELDRFASTLTRAKLEGSLSDTVFSFRATRTLFRPYQFKPVIKLLQTGKSRLLIADEVGLGKTIEAGLIWTELEARRNADRVLVICPSNLVAKWRQEMDERFNFTLQELSGPALHEFAEKARTGRLPNRGAYIGSLEKLRTWEELQDISSVIPQFDLVIIDEAHYLRNTGTRSNALGALIGELTDNMVFLTATPLNLRSTDLFNLLDLLSPGEFGDPTALEEQLAPNGILHKIAESLNVAEVHAKQRVGLLESIGDLTFGRPLTGRPEFAMLRTLLASDDLTPSDIVAARRNIADLNALSAVLTRTRKVEVDEDKALRDPRQVEVIWDEVEAGFYNEFYEWCRERADRAGTHIGFSQQMPLRLASACLPAARDSVLNWTPARAAPVDEDDAKDVEPNASNSVPPHPALVAAAEQLGGRDSKAARLIPLVSELVANDRRALLFTFSRPTLEYLRKVLTPHARVAVLHGGVKHAVRRQIMSDFRLGKYDIVLANRVASEGLDFEFCAAVINYDLPWNPMEVEQRIGRIDRIGQVEEKIAVINFYNELTIDERIMLKVLQRIGLFERSIGALEPIVHSRLTDLTTAMLDFSLTAEQREAKADAATQAIEAQAAGLEDLAEASSLLLAADDVDVRGMEDDLLRTGRYVGQGELVHLLGDWCATAGARGVRIDAYGRTVTVRGNPAMAEHLRGVVARGRRTSDEVNELISMLQSEIEIVLLLDQELARTAGGSLLTSTHPLVVGALSVPGFTQTRYASARVSLPADDIAEGRYLLQLAIAEWGGVRPGREIWSEAVDYQGKTAPRAVSEALMANLASGTLTPTSDGLDAQTARDLVEVTSQLLRRRQVDMSSVKQQEATSLLASRRTSLQSLHQRKMASLDDKVATAKKRESARAVALFEAQRRVATERLHQNIAALDSQTDAGLRLIPLAVCQLEVTHG